MSDRLRLDEYLPGFILELVEDSAIKWYNDSELAGDDRTARVVECLDTVYCSPHSSIHEEAITALHAGLYHRAVDIATGPDGDPIDDVEDIPGALGNFEYAVLRGYHTKAALEEHCSVTEEIAPAAMLNMATRWADGKEAYKWTFEAIDDGYRGDYEPKHVTTRQRSALEELQWSFLKEGDN